MLLTTEEQQECALLKQLFEEKAGMPLSHFVTLHNLGSADEFAQYLDGQRAVSLPVAMKIANLLGIKVADFSPRLAKEATALESDIIPMHRLTAKKIPLLSNDALRTLSSIEELREALVNATESVYGDDTMPEGAFALEIQGNDLTPEFFQGDTVVFDCDLMPESDDIVVAVVKVDEKAETVLAKYQLPGLNEDGEEYFVLTPLTDEAPSYRSDWQPCLLLGVLIEHRRVFKRSR